MWWSDSMHTYTYMRTGPDPEAVKAVMENAIQDAKEEESSVVIPPKDGPFWACVEAAISGYYPGVDITLVLICFIPGRDGSIIYRYGPNQDVAFAKLEPLQP